MPGREDVFQQAMNEGHSAAWDQDWQKAAAAYKKALDEMPNNHKALANLGLALYQLGNYDEALKVYIQTARTTPEDPISFEKIAQLYERQGNLKDAINAAFQAAELYLKMREVEKAIENWLRVVQLNPEHLQARSRLALIHEKTGQVKQAVTEYIAVASLLQNSGNPQKADETLTHALQIDPNNAEARQALTMVKGGKLLPMPVRPKGGTGPLRMAAVNEMAQPQQPKESPDPINEARQRAIKVLAEMLFDLSDESSEAQARRGLQSIMKGTGALQAQSEQTKILLHLSQVIDSQTKGQDAQAAEELDKAIENGLNHPAAYFDLGYLRVQTQRVESALRSLQHCIKHADYGLGARLLSGQVLVKMGRFKDAALEYIEALKLADSSVVSQEQGEVIRQLYEPLIDALGSNNDEAALQKICKSVEDMLVRKNWRQHLLKLRQEMQPSDGGDPLPLAEVLIQAQSSQVIDAMNRVNQLARANLMRSAMDEAFHALTYAPTYLPLHIMIGDLLIREDRVPDAITKFTVTANAYSVRGEAAQATKLLRKVIQLAPMDLAARTRLIEQLTARGEVDGAIEAYNDLADIYYRLAELDMARKTYTTALRLAQQPNANRQWGLQILKRMADIDLQRLDWKQALRVFEQIRTLQPDDASVRDRLVDLNLRLGQTQQAQAELDSFISYLDTHGLQTDAVTFLDRMIENHPDQPVLIRALASAYFKVGRLDDAVKELDALGEKLVEQGDNAGAVESIKQILAMNPPNAEQYQQVLAQLQGG